MEKAVSYKCSIGSVASFPSLHSVCRLQAEIHANFVLQVMNTVDETIDKRLRENFAGLKRFEMIVAMCVSYELPHNGRISHDGWLHGGPYKIPEL